MAGGVRSKVLDLYFEGMKPEFLPFLTNLILFPNIEMETNKKAFQARVTPRLPAPKAHTKCLSVETEKKNEEVLSPNA